MKKAFIENSTMFQLVTNKIGETNNFRLKFLKDLQKIHRKEWTHLGTFKKKGNLPTAYTLPKFSDIDKKLKNIRVRPIITYSNFAMKKTLSIVAIGLNFMLSKIDKNKHYDITDVNVVKKNLEVLQIQGFYLSRQISYLCMIILNLIWS
jgi:hypothetical protein